MVPDSSDRSLDAYPNNPRLITCSTKRLLSHSTVEEHVKMGEMIELIVALNLRMPAYVDSIDCSRHTWS